MTSPLSSAVEPAACSLPVRSTGRLLTVVSFVKNHSEITKHLQVNNYEIIVNFFHISHNLT